METYININTNMSSKFQPINIFNYLKQLGTTSTGHNNLTLLKELFDNSFDAGSKNIYLNKKEGSDDDGKKFYRIMYRDDGTGMDKENLFKCVQLYSENIKGGIGKFGIGGVSTLVNWCDIEDTEYQTHIIIISKTEDGITRRIKLDWTLCNTLQDYAEQVENSYTENDKDDINILNSEKNTRGTLIIIQTSKNKYSEIVEILDDMENYMNIGTTYYNYLERGCTMTMFDESIRHYAIPGILVSDLINIEIFERNSQFAFRSTIRKKIHSIQYKKNSKGKHITSRELEEMWDLKCDVKLKLEMPDEIKTHMKDNDIKSWKSFDKFCGVYGISDLEDIKYMAQKFIEPLYVAREDFQLNKRVLGALDIAIPKSFVNSNYHTIGLCLRKEMIFKHKYDDNLGLTQQNKSVIEWTNAPEGLKCYIETIIDFWIKETLVPKLIDIEEDKFEKEKPIQNWILKQQNYILRMHNNKYIPTYLNKSTPISAESAILKAIKIRLLNKLKIKLNTIIDKQKRILIIQEWFRSQNNTGGPTKGFIKFNKFLKWSFKNYHITKIQKRIRYFLIKRANLYNNLSVICKRISVKTNIIKIQRSWLAYKLRMHTYQLNNNAAIIIQNFVRGLLSSLHFKLKCAQEKTFVNLSNNLKQNMIFPTKRKQFIAFKNDIISKLKEMESLL